jgi:hypothetical protein
MHVTVVTINNVFIQLTMTVIDCAATLKKDQKIPHEKHPR